MLEDDCVVDLAELAKLRVADLPADSVTYFGGTIFPAGGIIKDAASGNTVADRQRRHAEIISGFAEGVLRIDPAKYKVMGAHAYYFPHWKVAAAVLHALKRPHSESCYYPIDKEFCRLQEKNSHITHLVYPAVAHLHMPDASKGIHARWMCRDMSRY